MKNLINLNRIAVIAAAIAFVAVGSASAQNRATTSADINAKIVTGISLAKTRDLNFGSIVRSAAGGTVVLNATSGAITFNGVTQGQTRNQQTAAFTATGESSYLYTVSLPSTATLSQTGNGNHGSMTVSNFTSSDGAGTLSNEGTQSFNVGGTLQVSANQAAGTYTGSFEVTVQYQ